MTIPTMTWQRLKSLSAINWQTLMLPLALAAALAAAMAATPAQAQNYKFKVLHTFQGKDGIGPDAQLVRDLAGNLYGTTAGGGANNCGGVGCGTAFKMDKTGKILWSHSFNGADGDAPFGLLRSGAGDLYGTTVFGGTPSHSCAAGWCSRSILPATRRCCIPLRSMTEPALRLRRPWTRVEIYTGQRSSAAIWHAMAG